MSTVGQVDYDFYPYHHPYASHYQHPFDYNNMSEQEKVLLLNHPNVHTELALVAHHRIQHQRQHGDEDGPNLFVVLPTQSTADGRFHDYRFFFLCDYGYGQPPNETPKLHLCQDHLQGFQSSLGGHPLKDKDQFCETHKIPMLALLRALQENHGRDAPGTVADPIISARVHAAIRYLANLSGEELMDFEENPSNPQDQENSAADDYTSFVPLVADDFWDPERVLVQGKVYGGLCQMSTKVGGVLWLCQPHNELFCKAPAAEKLRSFIKANMGDCSPMEKSAEIQLVQRDAAREFYGMLVEYQCVMKLKISLGWPDLGEADLWELCHVVHASNLREVMIDGCGSERAAAAAADSTHPSHGNMSSMLSFKPLLGMIFSQGLVSLAVDNFDGQLPPVSSFHVQGTRESFSLTSFQHQPAHIHVIPSNNYLKKLAFSHWRQKPALDSLAVLLTCSPNLTDIDVECESLVETFNMVLRATGGLQMIGYLKLSEDARELVELTIRSNEDGQRMIRSMQRKTSRLPSQDLQQRTCQLENLTFTNKELLLWDNRQSLKNLIMHNYESLTSIELPCQTDRMADLWLYLAHVPGTQKFYLRLNDELCSLVSEEPRDPSKTGLVIQSYRDGSNPANVNSHRRLLRSLGNVATVLVISPEMRDANQLKKLSQHLAMDVDGEGGARFYDLTWFMNRQQYLYYREQEDDLEDLLSLTASMSTSNNNNGEDHHHYQNRQNHQQQPPSQRRNRGELNEFLHALRQILHQIVHRPQDDGRIQTRFSIRCFESLFEEDQGHELVHHWDLLTGMDLGGRCRQWIRDIALVSHHPYTERVGLGPGRELSFASTNTILTSVPSETLSASGGSSWETGVLNSRPMTFSLECLYSRT